MSQIETGDLAGSAGGTARLNEHEWAMLGRSVAVKPEDHIGEAPSIDDPVVAPAGKPTDDLIDRIDERSEGPHPLSDADFEFPIKILVAGQERPGIFRGNDCFILLDKGEEYAIRIENRKQSTVMMRLLVDGLNTLPQVVGKGVETTEIAPRVNLQDARAWVLDPAKRRRYTVKGFFTSTGRKAKFRTFEVTDAAEGIAARRNFTDQIGMITVVFYNKASGSRGVATKLGREDETTVQTYRAKVGDLLAVVNIRYVSPAALRQLQND